MAAREDEAMTRRDQDAPLTLPDDWDREAFDALIAQARAEERAIREKRLEQFEAGDRALDKQLVERARAEERERYEERLEACIADATQLQSERIEELTEQLTALEAEERERVSRVIAEVRALRSGGHLFDATWRAACDAIEAALGEGDGDG